MRPNLRWPLVVAAVFALVRVPIELQGAPKGVSNLVSVVLLYMLVFPIVFAVQIGMSGSLKPFRTQFTTTALYAFLCRVLLMPIYWIAYFQNWTAPRFQYPDGGGVVGAPPYLAFLIPLFLAAGWTVMATIVGGILGSIVIGVMRLVRKP